MFLRFFWVRVGVFFLFVWFFLGPLWMLKAVEVEVVVVVVAVGVGVGYGCLLFAVCSLLFVYVFF